MKEKKRLRWWQISIIVLISVGLVVGGGIGLLNRRMRIYEEQLSARNKTGVVFRGSITTTVYGSGALSAAELLPVQSELTAKVLKVYYTNGDAVEKGSCIGLLDGSGLEDDIKAAQETLEELEDGLAALPLSGHNSLYAGAPARVKEVYAEIGDTVEAVQSVHGCLAVLSLDGNMEVTLNNEKLSIGDTVTLQLGVESQDGYVVEIREGHAVILTEDTSWNSGEEVVVYKDGESIGRGALEVHRPYPVKGTTGIIRSVPTVNDAVSLGTRLFRLEGKILSAQLLAQYDAIRDAKKALSDLVDNREKLKITAPESGILANMTLSEGLYTQKNAIAFQIATGGMELLIDVDELDILSVAKGYNATVELPALENTVLSAKVVGISRSGISAGGVTTYSVTLRLQDDPRLYLGMTADAEISTGFAENTLLVPVEALITRDGQKFLSVPGDDITEETLIPVSIGLANDTYVQILSGAEEGQQVYLTRADTNDFFAMFQSARKNMVSGDAS
ncbi:MAG: HlyD family efflux transporter periplasmic adaptor subunit [Christensenellales bacterium]|jgi:HlyD family secretion protein